MNTNNYLRITMDIKDYIIHQTAGHLYWKDIKGKYLGCNMNFAKTIGLDNPNNIIGKTDRDLFLQYLGEDGTNAIMELDQNIINSGQEQIVTEIGLNKQNQPTTYITRKIPLKNQDGKIIGLIGTSLDLSSYLDIKDRVIAHTAGNLYWKDKYGRYLGCNEGFAQVLKLNSPLDIVGKNDYDFFLDAEHVKAIIETDQSVINSGNEITLEEVGTGLDGKLATYLTKKAPLKNEKGEIIGLVGTSIDITKQKQAEITKSEFLKNMNHDIRTPLVGIYSLAQLLSDDETDLEKKSLLDDIIQSAERLTALLNEILEISNLGTQPVEYTNFNLKELIEESAALMTAAFTAKGLALSINSPDVIVKSDKFRLNKILVNLISNAIKFTPTGGIFIDAKLVGKNIEIRVKDTGIGIPADKISVIFDKFTKIAPSHVYQNFSGSGIGLYIVKQYILELSGDITVESMPNEGAIFCVVIPNLMYL